MILAVTTECDTNIPVKGPDSGCEILGNVWRVEVRSEQANKTALPRLDKNNGLQVHGC